MDINLDGNTLIDGYFAGLLTGPEGSDIITILPEQNGGLKIMPWGTGVMIQFPADGNYNNLGGIIDLNGNVLAAEAGAPAEFFEDASGGDICYRNQIGNQLLLGTEDYVYSGNSALRISSAGITTIGGNVLDNGKGALVFPNLPTSDPGHEGQLWNNGGVLSVSAGSPGLLTGIVAYWKLDEGAGTTRLDSSGNGYDMADTNGVGQAPGLIGKAAAFNYPASGNYLSNANGLVEGLSTFTMCGWMQLSDITFVTLNTPAMIMDANGDNSDCAVALWGAALVYIGGTRYQVGDLTPTDKNWHFMMIRYDGSYLTVQMDNEPYTAGDNICSFAMTGVVNSPGAPTVIGAAIPWGGGATGLIQNVGIWSRALSDAEAGVLYNGGAGYSPY